MDFWGDRRGQPVQIGFILLFGILVLAFASYQGYVVPHQNAQVEFQHSQEVTGEMQTFRVNLLNAAENGQRYATEFRLGTNYPPRLIALNPPPASGTLRTESLGSGELRLVAGDDSLEDICGYSRDGDGTVPSKGLVYQPSYSEMRDEPRVVYENTVSYRSFESSGAVQFDSEQTLIDGQKITVPPLVGNVSKHGTQTHTVDVYPGKAGVGDTAGTSVKLIVPTDLTVPQWEELLADEMAPDGPVTGVQANGSDVEIQLESAEYDIVCPVVGTGGAPGNSPDRVRGAGDDINPGGAGDVRLSDVERHPDNKDYIVLSFTNPGDDVNLSTGRFNFYQADNDDGPERLDVHQYDRSTVTLGTQIVDDLLLRGDYKSPTTTTTFPGDDDVTSIAVEFEEDSTRYSPESGDIVVLNLGFSDGQRANYFIDVPKTGTTVTNDPPTADFTYDPTSPSTNEDIDFTSSASDPDGNIVSYEWDWDDDGTFEGSGETATHSYSSSGTYPVTHRVTDNSGATDTVTKDVTVGSGGGTGVSGDGFTSVAASDFQAKNNQDQVLDFQLNESLASDETVEIDLSDAADGGVDYSGASVSSTTGGSGTATLSGNRVVYSSNGDGSGTSVSITVSSIDGRNGAGTYAAVFQRSDASQSDSDTFTVG